jgi:hypothetical protein
MKKSCWALAGLLVFASVALAQTPERWFHIHVDSKGDKGEIVRVNVPLSVAEQVLPAIHAQGLNDGKVKIHGQMKDVDVRALLEAVANSPDNEFVSVQSKEQKVRVAKSGEYLLVKVRNHDGKNQESPQQVDVKVPLSVVRALLSDSQSPDELNVLAALKALKTYGNLDLVTVTDKNETVRIWVDSNNTAN